MKWLWPAIRARYAGHPTLRRVGRKLYRGEPSSEADRAAQPYTVLRDASDSTTLDTFSADIEQYNLAFDLYSKVLAANSDSNDADEWLEAMKAWFDDCDLADAMFFTSGVQRQTIVEPFIDDGRWRAGVSYLFTIHLHAQVPMKLV